MGWTSCRSNYTARRGAETIHILAQRRDRDTDMLLAALCATRQWYARRARQRIQPSQQNRNMLRRANEALMADVRNQGVHEVIGDQAAMDRRIVSARSDVRLHTGAAIGVGCHCWCRQRYIPSQGRSRVAEAYFSESYSQHVISPPVTQRRAAVHT